MDASHVAADVSLLLAALRRLGAGAPVSFSELIGDEALEQQLESLVGTLKAARKQGSIAFEGEVLLQGAHDDVLITLVDTAEIGEPPEPEDEIHYSDGVHDAEVAPSLAAFGALVASGAVTGETIVWKEGWDDWVALDECREKLGLAEGGAAPGAAEAEAEAVEGDEAGLAGSMQIQWNGKGAFQPVFAELTSTKLTIRKKEGGLVIATAPCENASCSLPKNERKGHQHCFRVDLQRPDTENCSKYMLSLPDAATCSQWMQAVKYGIATMRVSGKSAGSGSGGSGSSLNRGTSLLEAGKAFASSEVASGSDVGAKLSQLAGKGEGGGELQERALSMLSSVSTPEEAISAMKTNADFAEQVKDLAMTYVQDAVKSIEIPACAPNPFPAISSTVHSAQSQLSSRFF